MAWSISISSEGWSDIRSSLEKWSVEELAAALADYNYEIWHGGFDRPANVKHRGAWKKEKYLDLAHDILVDICFDCIEETNTCDNGGYFYWIDPEGYHKVEITDSDSDESDDDGVDARDNEWREYQATLSATA